MKFKKIIATVLTAVMMSTFFVSMPSNTKNVKASSSSYTTLDSQAYNGNDLGANYSKNSTTFKVWAPTASNVQLKRYKTGSDSESGAGVIGTNTMTKSSNGIWTITIEGDLKNEYYTYLVTVNGRTQETVDIYAKAVGVNGNRGMVVDLDSTNPSGWNNDKHVTVNNLTDETVWEVHVKDFSNSASSGVSSANRGKFLAFTEKDTTLNNDKVHPTCLNYLKQLGVTAVQILPMFDYATVNETNSNNEFNWGYDPKNYNVPEGSYSSNPYDGNVRINELKQAIQSIHSEGISVIMDVVYNHTYTDPKSEAKNDSWFERTVPGYYYRYSNGNLSNGSGCGNETNSDAAMYSKYMVDSILYWAKEYHIDGFRFDLMGIHDVDTMNKIREAVNKVNPDIVIYGEPWAGGTTSSDKTTATMDNMNKVDNNIGAFNDKLRDAIRGGTWEGINKGFVQGEKNKEELVKAGIQANSTTMAGYNKWAKQPSQVLQYVSCHDNYTLYDHLLLSLGRRNFSDRNDDIIQMNKLASGIYLTSQGGTFMQAGEEFARTKNGDGNSYKSSSSVNEIDWNRSLTYSNLVDWYKGLIAIRQAYSPFRDPSNTSNNTIYFSWGSNCPANVVAYTMNNKLNASNEWNYVSVIHNANSYSTNVTLQGYNTIPTKWVVIADGNKAGVEKISEISGTTVNVPARSTMILVDKDSFDAHPVVKQGKVTIKYVDASTGKEISIASSINGKIGTSYSTSPKYIEDYELVSTPSNATGTYSEDETTVIYKYKYAPSIKGTVTIKYIDKETGKEIAQTKVISGKEGSNYTTSAETIKGYEVDNSSLPSNASGFYTSSNIDVTYYYNKKIVKDLTVHYYNSKNWSNVYLYAYDESGSKVVNYTGSWPGSKMDNDGNGWYSYEVDSVTSATIILNNNAGSQEPSGVGTPGYNAEGEIWVKDGKIYESDPDVVYSNVITKYVDAESNEEIAQSSIAKGIVGKTYTTTAKDIDGYELSKTPENANGTYTVSDITVIYKYVKKHTNVEITNLNTNVSSVEVGKSVKITANAQGDNVKYKFSVRKNGVEKVIRSFKEKNSVIWKPMESGKYTIICKAKNDEGEDLKEIKFNVENKTELKIINAGTNLQSPQKVKTSIKLGMEATGKGTLLYRFVVLKDGKCEYVRGYTKTNYTKWKPTEAGTYIIYYKVKDSTGAEVTKTINYVIK